MEGGRLIAAVSTANTRAHPSLPRTWHENDTWHESAAREPGAWHTILALDR